MDTSDFVVNSINCVFEHNLKKIEAPENELNLFNFKDVPLAEYQHFYYESAKGDPREKLENLSAKEYFDQEKLELDDNWNEDLMYLVISNDETIGVLNLRIGVHPVTGDKEGAINYLGLIGSKRRKGYGKDLHLTALKKLHSLGCKSYFGGTDNKNKGMLKIFERNNCVRAETQYYYKAEKQLA